MHYLGIDPGASGGLALLNDYDDSVWFKPTPHSELDIWNCISGMLTDHGLDIYGASTHEEELPLICSIEKVGGYVGKEQPGSAMFNFGWSYGGLRMVVVGLLGTLPQEITPQEWQKGLGIPPRKKSVKGQEGESQSQFKRRLKKQAETLFPNLHITLQTCDALLIATYARQKHLITRSG